jgi:hypothetical protein
MKAAILDGSILATLTADRAKTMKTLVEEEHGVAPEDVLRLAEVARPTTGVTRSWPFNSPQPGGPKAVRCRGSCAANS